MTKYLNITILLFILILSTSCIVEETEEHAEGLLSVDPPSEAVGEEVDDPAEPNGD